jgi:hypothetical protein
MVFASSTAGESYMHELLLTSESKSVGHKAINFDKLLWQSEGISNLLNGFERTRDVCVGKI